jgi:alkylation response protein AidB-like acyl-CoA dehydrogenase
MTAPEAHGLLEVFLDKADAWLAARYPRAADATDRRFIWGEGDDEVRVFQEPDPEQEADALPAIRRWRQDLWDQGYGWIAGPPEYGGAGLPGGYARAFERLTRGYRVPGDGALTISLGMVAPTILRHGSERQKEHWLPGSPASSFPSPTPARTWPRSGRRPCATATAGASADRRSGRQARTWPMSARSSAAPPTSRGTAT